MTPFASEFLTSTAFALAGTAVACNARLARTAGNGLPWPAACAGWGAAFGLAMFLGRIGGAQLNPAATVALWQLDRLAGAEAGMRILGQFIGALVGMALAWAAFIPHWARSAEAVPVDVFFRPPAVRAPLSNLLASAIGSAAFAYLLLRLLAGATLAGAADADGTDAGFMPGTATPFMVAHPFEGSLLSGIGFALLLAGIGGTGAPVMAQSAISGRVAQALLPIPGKGAADWRDAWIAIAGPAVGAFAAAALWRATVG